MRKVASRILILAVILGVASFTLGEDVKAVKVTGWVTDDHCGAKGASADHAACAAKCVKEKGAKWALYVPEDKTVYILSDQAEAAKHASKEVKVMAKMDKEKKTAAVTDWTWD